MNYKTTLVLFSFLCLTHALMAQEGRSHGNKQFKIAPWRLIDPIHSGIELSYEVRHSSKFSTQIAPAYLFKTVFNQEYKNYSGFRLGLEEKYFIPNRTSPSTYISAELIYQVNRFSAAQGFLHDSTASSPQFQYIDSITIHRKATIFNIRVGWQIIEKGIVADLSIGVGVRFRSVNHEGKIYPGDDLISPRHPNVHYYANTEKRDAVLNIPLNIRLGFTF